MGRFWILIVGCSLCLSAEATRWVVLTVEELTRQAEVVVHGTVASIEVRRDQERRVFSRVEIDPREFWKGNPGTNHLTIEMGGGVLGTLQEGAIGQAQFQVGEEVVIYATRTPAGTLATVGLGQGKFHVERAAAGAPATVRNAASVPEVETGGVKFPGARTLSLEELRRRSREVQP